MKKFTWLLVGILGVAVLFGSIAVVSAATGNGTASRAGFGKGQGVAIGQRFENFESDIATYLGISVETLQSERISGKSLATIAVEHGKTEEELIQFIVSKKTTYLNDLLSQGKITQTQYDNAVKTLTERTKTMVERTSTGRLSDRGANGSNQGRFGIGNSEAKRGQGNGTCIKTQTNP
ncbi:hypothetical protein [Caldisericum exile]|uniref:DUF2680 domain-containing protein n=1 Tax=Caldisericum exile (strain DSM 21853 / NBRC 104410 / AZM16c01) TaxID=511051 RepID=A0A7U6JF83_CALEA|nr:hypothetical protein [Caldisericum exile]BAL80149.1 hypothetical protein CSE_00230 [Caldisericum exile AZM16c01]